MTSGSDWLFCVLEKLGPKWLGGSQQIDIFGNRRKPLEIHRRMVQSKHTTVSQWSNLRLQQQQQQATSSNSKCHNVL